MVVVSIHYTLFIATMMDYCETKLLGTYYTLLVTIVASCGRDMPSHFMTAADLLRSRTKWATSQRSVRSDIYRSTQHDTEYICACSRVECYLAYVGGG